LFSNIPTAVVWEGPVLEQTGFAWASGALNGRGRRPEVQQTTAGADRLKLYTIDAVPTDPRQTVFRYSLRADGLAMPVFLSIAVGCLWLGLSGGVRTKWWGTSLIIPAFVAYSFVGVSLLFLVFTATSLRKRLGPTNWLALAQSDGIVVTFRSLMNDHFPKQDPVAIKIAYSEISWARICKEKRILRNLMDEGTAWETLTVLELNLKDGLDSTAFRMQLVEEMLREAPLRRTWYGKARTRFQHNPVRMEPPDRLRIEWAVVPAHPEGRRDPEVPHSHLLSGQAYQRLHLAGDAS